jgi:hypothetical protein
LSQSFFSRSENDSLSKTEGVASNDFIHGWILRKTVPCHIEFTGPQQPCHVIQIFSKNVNDGEIYRYQTTPFDPCFPTLNKISSPMFSNTCCPCTSSTRWVPLITFPISLLQARSHSLLFLSDLLQANNATALCNQPSQVPTHTR